MGSLQDDGRRAESRSLPADAMASILKTDVFGGVELVQRGGDLVVRRVARGSAVPGSRRLARLLARHEQRILARLVHLPGVPRPEGDDGAGAFYRSYLAGRPLHEHGALGARYWDALLALVAAVHAAGMVHNDLAKEANILVTDRGEPALVDFQIALWFRVPQRWPARRLFAALCRDDVRHVLKQKALHDPELVTAAERLALRHRSLVNRVWSATLRRPWQRLVCALGWEPQRGPVGR